MTKNAKNAFGALHKIKERKGIFQCSKLPF